MMCPLFTVTRVVCQADRGQKLDHGVEVADATGVEATAAGEASVSCMPEEVCQTDGGHKLDHGVEVADAIGEALVSRIPKDICEICFNI